MEIERKWLVEGWPEERFPLLYEQNMRQGYVTVRPTVRIREEAENGCEPSYILCFKSPGTLARKEIEMPVEKGIFAQLEDLIGLPLIPKVRRTFELPDGLHLEVNHVDEGQPTEFWYAEVEFPDLMTACTWRAESCGLSEYLSHEVTAEPGQTMGAYWEKTRVRNLAAAPEDEEQPE